jgi:hypothetical protein
MNKYYSYENIELWKDEYWKDKASHLAGLVLWNQANEKLIEREYPTDYTGALLMHPEYNAKIGAIEDSNVIKYWADKGLQMSILSQDNYWISMVPEKAIKDRSKKLPVLVVTHTESYSDPWWAVKTVEHYKKYNEMLAKSQDFIIIYLVAQEPDVEGNYLSLMQEAFILYPTDLDRVYIDVTLAKEKGQKLSEIPKFIYAGNPDKAIETITIESLDIPVINVCGQWDNRDSLSRGLVMYFKQNKGKFDPELLIHSYTGKRMMDGIALEHDIDNLYQSEFIKHWEEMGLKYEIHEYNGERWVSMVPLCAYDEPEKKLPVILVMQEMYHGNEHLPVAGLTYFYQTCEIAAQGECILLFFALEHPDDNDMFVDILDDATGLYPIDRTRVYVTGHSHDGFFSYEFAYRHPDIITAVATLGDPCGLTYFGDPKMRIKDEQLEVLKNIDIPVINMLGTNEGGAVVPALGTKAFEDFAIAWQRRLKASCCPMKTTEEIEEAKNSEDYATRMIGLPVDKSSIIWSHGIEHYIGEVKNFDGKYHLNLFISQGMPHTTTPFMLDMAWSFLRRFARDPKTGEIIELY